MFLQTLNIEWGQIDPKDKRRVNILFWLTLVLGKPWFSKCTLILILFVSVLLFIQSSSQFYVERHVEK